MQLIVFPAPVSAGPAVAERFVIPAGTAKVHSKPATETPLTPANDRFTEKALPERAVPDERLNDWPVADRNGSSNGIRTAAILIGICVRMDRRVPTRKYQHY